MTDPKQRLLDAAIDYVATNGVGELSLRRMAAAIGTSHRMLIYHFGSKEGLLVEIIRAVEQAQRDALRNLELTPGSTLADVGRAFWARLADPALWPNERLFFEIYGQALQGRPGTTALLDRIVDDWLDPIAELYGRLGVPPDTIADHGFDANQWGLMAGADFRFAPTYVVGVSLGYGQSTVDFSPRGAGDLDTRAITGALYATMY